MYFQYFLPNRTKITRDELHTLGLGYVFDPESVAPQSANLSPRQVTNGPGGQHGLVVSLFSDFCGYYKDQQIWKQEVDCDYWVGMFTGDKRPTPETLRRENQITGEWLRLDDGHAWLLPKARHFEEFDGEIIVQRTLPCRMTRDESGQWYAGEVKERYRELWRLATELMQVILDETYATWSEVDNLAIQCFQVNYRVSAIELDLLGIYDDHVRYLAQHILLDMNGWDMLSKKKQATRDTGSLPPGLPGSPPVADTESTDPPAAT